MSACRRRRRHPSATLALSASLVTSLWKPPWADANASWMRAVRHVPCRRCKATTTIRQLAMRRLCRASAATPSSPATLSRTTSAGCSSDPRQPGLTLWSAPAAARRPRRARHGSASAALLKQRPVSGQPLPWACTKVRACGREFSTSHFLIGYASLRYPSSHRHNKSSTSL